MTTILTPYVQILTPPTSPSTTPPRSNTTPRRRQRHVVESVQKQDMDTFTSELRTLFEDQLHVETLQQHSEKLQREYRDKLKRSDISMLPSYNHTLPTGDEKGQYLALDVGGSTFRVALVSLAGRHKEDCIRKSHLDTYQIGETVKRLRGQMFFDWMAERIRQTLTTCRRAGLVLSGPMPMGLAWSFPIEQTCPRSGNLLAMGKGFYATEGLEGQDLTSIIMRSCLKKCVDVELCAIINDSAATLLSQAYRDPTTCMSLILGTGMNSAVYLPPSIIGSEKLAHRSPAWHRAANRVLVNTELSMFGKGIMPVTRWDEQLNRDHRLPDFQPMEYLCTGMYIGEIVRLILLEAVETAGLFGGERPGRMSNPYSLDTRIVAAFENDESSALTNARTTFLQAHPLAAKPSRADLHFVQTVARLVSHRAQAYIATAFHALWRIRPSAQSVQPSQDARLTVACNGAVIEKYPGFRSNCQGFLDSLCIGNGMPAGTVTLEMAPESSIYGAAVAVACITDD